MRPQELNNSGFQDIFAKMDTFGMGIKTRNFVEFKDFRYSFNGKEKTDEISGSGASYDYGFRIYDPRLGKFLSVDPLTTQYPELTPYQFASNMPIFALDLDGLESVGYFGPFEGQKDGSGAIKVLEKTDTYTQAINTFKSATNTNLDFAVLSVHLAAAGKPTTNTGQTGYISVYTLQDAFKLATAEEQKVFLATHLGSGIVKAAPEDITDDFLIFAKQSAKDGHDIALALVDDSEIGTDRISKFKSATTIAHEFIAHILPVFSGRQKEKKHTPNEDWEHFRYFAPRDENGKLIDTPANRDKYYGGVSPKDGDEGANSKARKISNEIRKVLNLEEKQKKQK